MVEPTQPEPKWTAAPEAGQPVAYVGLDAFSVPMQGVQASKAQHRMLYTALLYTPDKEHTRYLVDFELDALAEQVRRAGATPDPVRAAVLLLAVADGLTAHVLGGHLGPADALTALDDQLDHAFGALS